jgi:kinesin family protein C1
MHSTQADVFAEVSQLVQSALDGYKVCLFSYGQTGAGKTHTMLGCGSGEQRGIIPRAVEKVRYTVSCSPGLGLTCLG